MMIKTPKFWLKKNIISLFLWPLSLIYRVLFYFSHNFKEKIEVKTPIICVGNLTAGGAGKTPTVLALGEILAKNNIEFAFLSRGHRGKEQNVREVNFEKCEASDVGDEPLLLSEKAPTFMSKSRIDGIKHIEKKGGCEVIILDDGMQNATLKKDLVIMVVDGKIKFGNQFLLPAGPLRQSIKSGLKNCDLVVVIGEIDGELNDILNEKISENKVIVSKIRPKNIEKFKNEELLAFCGLAYPQKFFSFIEDCGLNLEESIGFADHYDYSDQDLENLIRKSEEKSQKLVTTKKDWIKFSEKYRQKIDFLDVDLEFENEEVIFENIKKIIK